MDNRRSSREKGRDISINFLRLFRKSDRGTVRGRVYVLSLSWNISIRGGGSGAGDIFLSQRWSLGLGNFTYAFISVIPVLLLVLVLIVFGGPSLVPWRPPRVFVVSGQSDDQKRVYRRSPTKIVETIGTS